MDLEEEIVNVRRSLATLDMFGPLKTNAGIRTVTLLRPTLGVLKEQYELIGHHRKSEITFYHREYGRTEKQKLHFVFMPRVCDGKQKPYYSVSSLEARWNVVVKRAGIRRHNPYHTRRTFTCWLLTVGVNLAFITSQMGHEAAQMVCEIYSMWIDDANDRQVAMLNARLSQLQSLSPIYPIQYQKTEIMQENQQITKKEQYNLDKLQKRPHRNMGEVIANFNMVEGGGRIMVCLSGDKDSYTMLGTPYNSQQSVLINFSLMAVNLDQKQSGFPEHTLPGYPEKLGAGYKTVEENTYGIVEERIPKGKTTYSPYPRLRRGILYRAVTELGTVKIALGHHRDDALQMLFLNMFYGGRMKGMPPKLMSDDDKHIVTRPLAYCREKDIQRFADAKAFPVIPRNLCGSQPNLQRRVIADMLRDWDRRYPGRIETVLSATQNVVPSYLYDTNLFDFEGISHDSKVVNGGNLAFDREEIPPQPVGWQPEEDENQSDEL